MSSFPAHRAPAVSTPHPLRRASDWPAVRRRTAPPAERNGHPARRASDRLVTPPTRLTPAPRRLATPRRRRTRRAPARTAASGRSDGSGDSGGSDGPGGGSRERPGPGPDGQARAVLTRLARPPVELELIVPAFNEEHRLPATLAATLDHLARRPWTSAVVVVDNDSCDATRDVVARFEAARGPDRPSPVYVLGCSERGKGAAVRRGIATSAARYIGFIDADNATPIGTLDAVMARLEEGYGSVIGSRRAPGARYEVRQSQLRQGGGWVFRRLARRAVPGVADTQCGFKFFDGPAVRAVLGGCHVDGFAFDVELLARLVRTGRQVVEVPVAWSDVPGSTFSPRRDGLRSLTDLLRISLTR